LAGIGWLDRRGHLKFRAPGVFIDADIPESLAIRSPLRRDPLGGPVALAAAFDALRLYPEPASKVRMLARMLDASPAGVSQALSRLVDAGLLTKSRVAAVPGLFWAVVDTWDPDWVELGWSPEPSDRLVAVGSAAAAALGAPVAAKSSPLELLAADERVLRTVLRKDAAHKPSNAKPKAPVRVALAPSPVVFESDRSSAKVRGHRVAHPTAVAASIAADKARGAEIVESWELADRAW
jgi:DNA-binding transcriptional ArsR family regulator